MQEFNERRMNMCYSDRRDVYGSFRIAIIGIDGSGKSSCFKGVLKKLSKKKSGGIGGEVFISEKGELSKPKIKYLKIKTFLGKRIKNIENRTLYKLLKFTELILRVKLHDEIEKRYKPEIVLTDGVPLINTLGWGKLYYPDVLNEATCRDAVKYLTKTKIPPSLKGFYLKYLPEIFFVNILGIKFQKPDIVFFLKVAPEVAVNRVGKRGEKRQVHETEIFLSKLQEAYQQVCTILSEDTKIYTIDTNGKTLKQVIDIGGERIR